MTVLIQQRKRPTRRPQPKPDRPVPSTGRVVHAQHTSRRAAEWLRRTG